MYELRLPNITGTTEREQLSQVKSYLYGFVENLQWILNTIDTSVVSVNTAIQEEKPKTTTSVVASADTKVSFDALKPLIIKSADIVNAYYDEISSRLEGLYVAESDFGTFTEQTAQEILQSSTDIEQLFTDIQAIVTDIANLNFTLAEANAYIRSGLLYYSGGVPVYGLEIGQTTILDGAEVFNKFARFTADRLSFYDQNDTEVAYISDYKLNIRNVEITSSYKIGGYVDIVKADGGVITKWVGGNG